MGKYIVSTTGETVDIDESPQTFEQALEGLRRIEERTNGAIKITKWPKDINDWHALQVQGGSNKVHNLYSWILNDEGLIIYVKPLGWRDNLEGNLEN